MATFLDLCKKLARKSGAINPAPSTVISQSGRKQLCVDWVRDAWVSIQNVSPYWSWLRAEFEGSLVIGQARYSADDMGASRFKEWIGDTPRGRGLSLYDPLIGRKDEGELRQVPYEAWRRSYDFGVHDPNRPTVWAIGPNGDLCFGATPYKAYQVRGEYRMRPQILALDADIPELPENFHDIIVYRAIMMMAEDDEAVQALQMAQIEYKGMLADLSRDYLPQFSTSSAGPLDR